MKTTSKSNSRESRPKTKRCTQTLRAGKPRCDSTLDGLAKDRKERLAGWLLDENRGYVEVRELVAREWGVRTSRSALGRYYRRTLAAERLASSDKWQVTSDESDQREEADATEAADPSSLKLRRGYESFGEATRRRAQQLGFMALMQPKPDWKAARVFLGIVDRIERRELARERLRLSERRAKRVAGRGAPPKPAWMKMPYEERMRWLKGIFGGGPDYLYAQWMTEEEKAIHLRPGQARDAEGGTRDGQGGSSEVAAANAAQQRRSETAPLQEGVKTGESPGVPGSCRDITAKPAVFSSADGAMVDRAQTGDGVGAAPTAAVSFGRVLGAESGAAGFHSVVQQNAQDQTAATSAHQVVTARAVIDWLTENPGVCGSFRFGSVNPEAIFGSGGRKK